MTEAVIRRQAPRSPSWASFIARKSLEEKDGLTILSSQQLELL